MLTVRPGLIVGPHDPTDRFTYWPVRVARGGDVLAPGRPERRVAFVDVRDLAEWIVRMVEARRVGVFNAEGPDHTLTMQQLLERSQAVSGSDVRRVWIDEQFLLDAGIAPWSEMPLWIPESDPDAAGFFAFNFDKALAAGLTFRPLEETIRDTLEWNATQPLDREWRAGLTADKEADLLKRWHDTVMSDRNLSAPPHSWR